MIIFFASFIFFFLVPTWSLALLICLIISCSALLLIIGLEFFALLYAITYIGVVLVFFIFVIILLDLRYRRSFFSLSWGNFAVYGLFTIFSFLFDYCIITDFSNLETYYENRYTLYRSKDELDQILSRFYSISDLGYVSKHELIYFGDIFEPNYFGFFLFSYAGVVSGFISLLLFFSLVSSLTIVGLLSEKS